MRSRTLDSQIHTGKIGRVPTGITGKGRATRQRIIEAAASVVRARGVGGTGLDEIRAAAAVSSSQLFHYFPDGKNQLLLAVAGYEADQVLAGQQPLLGHLTSWAAWESWSDALYERYRAQGERCELSALADHLDPADGAVRAVITGMYDRWRASLADGIRSLQAQGEARPDLDPGGTASAVLAGIQGGVIMMLATGSPDHLRAALDASLQLLRTRPTGS
jgi:AcrR family transcriptional regulator